MNWRVIAHTWLLGLVALFMLAGCCKPANIQILSVPVENGHRVLAASGQPASLGRLLRHPQTVNLISFIQLIYRKKYILMRY